MMNYIVSIVHDSCLRRPLVVASRSIVLVPGLLTPDAQSTAWASAEPFQLASTIEAPLVYLASPTTW